MEFNRDFLVRLIPKLDWSAVVEAAASLDKQGDLKVEDVNREDYAEDQDFLKRVHHVLLEVEVINGELVCPETGRAFPVSDGIPNMLLNEDEVS